MLSTLKMQAKITLPDYIRRLLPVPNTVAIMISTCSALFALLLCSELNGCSVAAVPATSVEVDVMDQDGLGLIPSDEPVAQPALVPPPVVRRSLILDNSDRGVDQGTSKILIIPDLRLKGRGARGPSSAFTRSLPPHADRSLSHTPPEYSLKVERRDTDLDMLRCMIGRVYRPCWEV